MDFEAHYLSEVAAWEHEASWLVEGLATRGRKVSAMEAQIELMDANLFHVLQLTDRRLRRDMLRSAVKSLLTNRNVDHVLACKLRDYLEVSDPGSVLAEVGRGRSFMFLGFHTGPYWTLFTPLIEAGVDIVTLFPPALDRKRQEIEEMIAAMKEECASPSNLTLVGIDDPAFLVQLRKGLKQGTQIVVYLDGDSGAPLPKTPKRDVTLPFFHSEITVKTTLFRMAQMFDLPVVTFNAARNGIGRNLLLEPLPQQSSYELTVETAYSRLRDRLAVAPAQWEGWLYFHKYFSDGFRSSLEGETGDDCFDRDQRYFLLDADNESLVFDKQTYKQYRVKGNGANRAA